MKLGVLQLSDAHIKSTTDPIVVRADALAEAAWSRLVDTDLQLVLLTGDLAYSGKPAEYAAFNKLLDAVLAACPGRVRVSAPHLFVIPGNHDCDFDRESDTRQMLLERGPSALGNLRADSDVLSHLLEIQDGFFTFANRTTGLTLEGAHAKLAHSRYLQAGSSTVRVIHLNSALLTKLKEEQGRLTIPKAAMELLRNDPPADLTLALVHHPPNWLEHSNARVLIDLIDEHVDFVFMGHEHYDEAFTRQRLGREEVHLFRAEALQPDAVEDSGFLTLVIDLSSNEAQLCRYRLKGARFEPLDSIDSGVLRFRPGRKSAGSRPSPEDAFLRYLEDPGTGFTHPRKDSLALSDLFIPPDVVLQSPLRAHEPRSARREVQSSETIARLASINHLLITGEEKCGKTSLAKRLYVHLLAEGHVPVLLRPNDLRARESPGLAKAILECVAIQYGRPFVAAFEQMPPSKRCLIVDDVHALKLNASGKKHLIDHLRPFADQLLLLADEVFRYEELEYPDGDANPFADFEFATIQPAGYKLRSHLIERWLRLGQEHVLSEQDLAKQRDRAARAIETVIGKNLVPSLPFTVLTFLQLMEAGRDLSQGSGSYGYMYEQLIARAVNLDSPSAADLDMRYKFLSQLAWRLYREERSLLTRVEVQEEASGYMARFKVRYSLEAELTALERNRVLVVKNGGIQFRYPYFFFYFVARYFRDEMSRDGSLRDRLEHMADRVYSDRNTSILVFYLFLTQDRTVIERVVQNARAIYQEHTPCDFDSDVQFLNELFKGAITRTLELASSNQEEADSVLDQMDRNGAPSAGSVTQHEESDDITYDAALSDVIKLNIALKTLHILGQFVRNFPGSLDGAVKEEIVTESYLLGLRSLKAVLSACEANLDPLRMYFSEIAKDPRSSLSEAEQNRVGDQLLLWLTRGCSFGLLKRVSNAVGLEQLAQTYNDVLRSHESTATRLIDVSIKLDHFSSTPESEVHGLGKALRKNYFGMVVLRDLVQEYCRLFPLAYSERQRLTAWLEVGTGPEYLDSRARRLKRLPG